MGIWARKITSTSVILSEAISNAFSVADRRGIALQTDSGFRIQRISHLVRNERRIMIELGDRHACCAGSQRRRERHSGHISSVEDWWLTRFDNLKSTFMAYGPDELGT
jgi:hypothetical protein